MVINMKFVFIMENEIEIKNIYKVNVQDILRFVNYLLKS